MLCVGLHPCRTLNHETSIQDGVGHRFLRLIATAIRRKYVVASVSKDAVVLNEWRKTSNDVWPGEWKNYMASLMNSPSPSKKKVTPVRWDSRLSGWWESRRRTRKSCFFLFNGSTSNWFVSIGRSARFSHHLSSTNQRFLVEKLSATAKNDRC